MSICCQFCSLSFSILLVKTIRYKEYLKSSFSKTVCPIWLKCLVCLSLCNRPILISNRATSFCLLHLNFTVGLFLDFLDYKIHTVPAFLTSPDCNASFWVVPAWGLFLLGQAFLGYKMSAYLNGSLFRVARSQDFCDSQFTLLITLIDVYG